MRRKGPNLKTGSSGAQLSAAASPFAVDARLKTHWACVCRVSLFSFPVQGVGNSFIPSSWLWRCSRQKGGVNYSLVLRPSEAPRLPPTHTLPAWGRNLLSNYANKSRRGWKRGNGFAMLPVITDSMAKRLHCKAVTFSFLQSMKPPHYLLLLPCDGGAPLASSHCKPLLAYGLYARKEKGEKKIIVDRNSRASWAVGGRKCLLLSRCREMNSRQ